MGSPSPSRLQGGLGPLSSTHRTLRRLSGLATGPYTLARLGARWASFSGRALYSTGKLGECSDMVAITPASPAFQASFNEQIKHIIRNLHAVFVQPQQQQDESLGGIIELQMIFARPIDHIPDFDRPVVVRSRDNLGPVRRKRDRVDCVAVGVRLLAQQPQRACQTSQKASVLAKEGRS